MESTNSAQVHSKNKVGKCAPTTKSITTTATSTPTRKHTQPNKTAEALESSRKMPMKSNNRNFSTNASKCKEDANYNNKDAVGKHKGTSNKDGSSSSFYSLRSLVKNKLSPSKLSVNESKQKGTSNYSDNSKDGKMNSNTICQKNKLLIDANTFANVSKGVDETRSNSNTKHTGNPGTTRVENRDSEGLCNQHQATKETDSDKEAAEEGDTIADEAIIKVRRPPSHSLPSIHRVNETYRPCRYSFDSSSMLDRIDTGCKQINRQIMQTSDKFIPSSRLKYPSASYGPSDSSRSNPSERTEASEEEDTIADENIIHVKRPPSYSLPSIYRGQEIYRPCRHSFDSSLSSMIGSNGRVQFQRQTLEAIVASKCISASDAVSTNSYQRVISKLHSTESRPIYPNVPYSPYGSPRKRNFQNADDGNTTETKEDDDLITNGARVEVKRPPSFSLPHIHRVSEIHRPYRYSFDSSLSSTLNNGDSEDDERTHGGWQFTPEAFSPIKGIFSKLNSVALNNSCGSPRDNRRRMTLCDSYRTSIEQSDSFVQFSQFKQMEQIRQGFYGLVMLAFSDGDSTQYAMKILSKRRLLRKASLMGRGSNKNLSPSERIYNEIALLKKLDHPNVVKLVEVLDDPLEDSLYFLFELVKEGEILSIPTDKPLSEDCARSVMRDAVKGLEYLHHQNIIHADIRPSNLLLNECSHVKLCDLGICNEFLDDDASIGNGSTIGTPAFRAPEMLLPGQHLMRSKASDIWALGTTLYSLVYGNVPFVATTISALYEKIKNESLIFPDMPTTIGDDLRDLLKRMLTKDPAKRITLPEIKEHSWITSRWVHPLPTEEDNCHSLQISDEDINTVLRSIPRLDTLILIKTALKPNKLMKASECDNLAAAPVHLDSFRRSARSNSAPGEHLFAMDRQFSSDNTLPSLSEHGGSSYSEDS